MRPILLLATGAVAVSARGSSIFTSQRAWNLPPTPTISQESLSSFVQRVSRGGGDPFGYGDNDPYDDRGYFNNNDDPYNDPNNDPYNQQYGNGDNYGDQQPDDYQDDRYREDRYDDRGTGAAVREICNIVIDCFGSSLVGLILFLCFCFCHCRNLLFKYPILLKWATDELVWHSWEPEVS